MGEAKRRNESGWTPLQGLSAQDLQQFEIEFKGLVDSSDKSFDIHLSRLEYLAIILAIQTANCNPDNRGDLMDVALSAARFMQKRYFGNRNSSLYKVLSMGWKSDSHDTVDIQDANLLLSITEPKTD
jgi:hypothetical protein